ncbi:MAG: HEAT repeat domain-containing protein [Oligoflexia bacterium]|nr:HEAT repeat domain-containing protein [Oligoflexia bacterium]
MNSFAVQTSNSANANDRETQFPSAHEPEEAPQIEAHDASCDVAMPEREVIDAWRRMLEAAPNSQEEIDQLLDGFLKYANSPTARSLLIDALAAEVGPKYLRDFYQFPDGTYAGYAGARHAKILETLAPYPSVELVELGLRIYDQRMRGMYSGSSAEDGVAAVPLVISEAAKSIPKETSAACAQHLLEWFCPANWQLRFGRALEQGKILNAHLTPEDRTAVSRKVSMWAIRQYEGSRINLSFEHDADLPLVQFLGVLNTAESRNTLRKMALEKLLVRPDVHDGDLYSLAFIPTLALPLTIGCVALGSRIFGQSHTGLQALFLVAVLVGSTVASIVLGDRWWSFRHRRGACPAMSAVAKEELSAMSPEEGAEAVALADLFDRKKKIEARQEVAQKFAGLWSPRSESKLLKLLDKPDPECRLGIAALSGTHDQQILQALKKIADSPSRSMEVRSAAVMALQHARFGL